MKLYLSSTYRDLQAYRAAVDQTLRKMGHDVIGMEQYAAEGSRPVVRCKRDVAMADIYVLMLGWRYGYVPADDNPNRLSITEIEYRHALANHKTVLAFLLDPEAPWPPSAMDSASADAKAAEDISNLRSEVGAQFLVGVFSTPEDLANQVAAAVASQGLTTSLSELVLNRADVSATAMGGFGTGSSLEDTSVMAIKQMISDAGKDRAIVVNLGGGDMWWSTRLFLLSSLLHSLTPVRQIVFTGRSGRFAGMASPSAVMDGLGARFAALNAFGQKLREGSPTEDRQRETDRQIDTWGSVFHGTGAAPPAARPAGDVAELALPVDERDVQVGVREELLQGWLGERLISRCIQVTGRPSMSQVQQIVDSLVPDVPLEVVPAPEPVPASATPTGPDAVEDSTVQIKVIDRDAFALELAREWVRTGLPRNPAL
jgi:hypothetical protein